jgi:uncharacterized protein
MGKGLVTVEALNYDLSVRKAWTAELIDDTQELISLHGVFDSEIRHTELGLIRQGTISEEYFFRDRWFNVFAFFEPDGTFRNYYCNVCVPPTFDGSRLAYVDLDIDLIVYPQAPPKVLDREEFESNARRYEYPTGVIEAAETALATLVEMVERREHPFTRAGSESRSCRPVSEHQP